MVSNIKKRLNIPIWPIDRILTGTTYLGQCGPRSNGIEGVLYNTHRSRTIRCHTQDTCWGGSYKLAEENKGSMLISQIFGLGSICIYIYIYMHTDQQYIKSKNNQFQEKVQCIQNRIIRWSSHVSSDIIFLVHEKL